MIFHSWNYPALMHPTSFLLWPFILSRVKSSLLVCLCLSRHATVTIAWKEHVVWWDQTMVAKRIRQDVKIEQGVAWAWSERGQSVVRAWSERGQSVKPPFVLPVRLFLSYYLCLITLNWYTCHIKMVNYVYGVIPGKGYLVCYLWSPNTS